MKTHTNVHQAALHESQSTNGRATQPQREKINAIDNVH